ncbi:MAG: hypothetical protein GW875_08095 [Deltaproteobacteria bacterium]|nr:hypothetical protein [Deltaproteobacteria bacterium]NCP02710.1 hypothetical protein [Deltaproteobacteria bacterium]
MSVAMLSFAGLVLVLVILTAVILGQRRQLERLREQLRRQPLKQQKSAFDQTLAQAETQPEGKPVVLEQPRTSAFQTDLTERYRCISAMARQGLNAHQISTILQISEGEARQVIRLAGVTPN